MLSIFEGPDEEKYVVWVKDDNSELNLLVSDGQEVWRSPHPVTSQDKPASRKHESDDVFLSQLKIALKRDASNAQGTFSVDIKAVESDLQLVVKETIGTTTTKSILFKCTLGRSVEQKPLFLKMFAEASEKMQNDLLEVHSLNKSIAEYASLVDTLSNTTKDMTSLKEKLHDELISKFCMVLNTKKREIERLNERIDELESQYESVQNTQQSLIDLSQTSTMAPPKAAPKAAPKATAKAAVKPAPRGRTAALKAATTPLECATGSKRKAATKMAPANKRKTTARKTRRGQSESESEEEEEGDETSESDEDASDSEESDGASHGSGQSEQEADLFEDIAPPIVTQSQKSTHGTQPSSNLNSPVTARKSASSRAKAVRGNESSGEKDVSSSSHSAVSAPIVTTESTHLQSVEEEESEEELLHSRPRATKVITKEPPVASKLPQSAVAGSTNSATALVTQSSVPAVSANGTKSSKSKFYEEESEDEGNCMDYI